MKSLACHQRVGRCVPRYITAGTERRDSKTDTGWNTPEHAVAEKQILS